MIPSNLIALRKLSGLALLLVTAFASASCGEDSTTGPVAPSAPPRATFQRVAPAGGRPVVEPTDGACVDASTDPGQTLVVVVGLENWTLAAPRGCLGAPQCGYLQVSAETETGQSVHVDAASPAASLSLEGLAAPLAPLTIRVEFRDDRGEPARDAAGEPFAGAELRIVREPRCGGALPEGGPPSTDSGIRDGGPLPPADAPVVVPDAPVVVPDATVVPDVVVPPDAPVIVPDAVAPLPDAGPVVTDAGMGATG